MAKKLYLAYGSNLDIRQMKRRCPNARVVGTAEIEDYELLFKGSKSGSYLTIEKKKGSTVPVAVWAVDENDERSLDRYEGFPSFYYKKDMRITYKGIKSQTSYTADAFVYIMHEDRKLGIPNSYYISTCLYGYDVFGFDPKHIFKAYDISRRDCNEN